MEETTQPMPHEECAALVREMFKNNGQDIDVSENLPPERETPSWDAKFLICPHLHTLWCVPTAEQAAKWEAEDAKEAAA